MNESHGISFVLCCYNSEKVINESIQALQGQLNSSIPYEVILVDNNCTDNTVRIARDLWKRADVELKIVSERMPGLMHARKRGVAFATYDYISFVDDDNFVERDWVVKVSAIFDKMCNVGAIGSHNNPITDEPPPQWFDKVQMNYACGKQLPTSGYLNGERKHLWGAGLSIRKVIIDEIFSSKHNLMMTGRSRDVITSGDDSEICFLCRLMGWDLWYENNLLLFHKIAPSRLNWKYYCKLNEGFGSASLVLGVYKRKIDKLPPESFLCVFGTTLKELLKALWQNKGFPKDPANGNFLHRDIYLLFGRLKGAYRLRKNYKSIVRSIYDRDY